MIRSQIQLTDKQYSRRKELKLHNRKFLVEMIKLAVDKLVISQQQPDRSALHR